VRPLTGILLLASAALSKGEGNAPALPPARVELRIDVPDLAGPWKMVVTNQGDVPVRFAADGRLLALEIQPKADAEGEAPTKKRKAAPRSTICKLPPELRPSGVVDDRAVVLGPGARYEEVVSPALYCFNNAGAKALVEGAEVTARLGFPGATTKGAKNVPPRPPLIVEPAVKDPTVSGLKELVSPSFVLPSPPATSSPPASKAQETNDPNGPRIELVAPSRIDTPNERTVSMTLTVRNAGGRSVPLHIRRDNLVIDLDGPDGSAHCGMPALQRSVAKDLFTTLGVGASRTVDVWVGEMCPDVVFDRPGLYRLRASLAFPNSSEGYSFKPWTQTVTAKELILVRVREGRLPFYASPPQVFGGAH
jgi:hypothetical protein